MVGRRKFLQRAVLVGSSLLGLKFLSVSAYPLAKNPVPALIENEDIFLHGVASGDPLATQVIIWTRISLASKEPVTVEWEIATDVNFQMLAGSGKVNTDASSDYTVKVDVTGLRPYTLYYYRFTADKIKSPVGKTRTTSLKGTESLRLAVVSCSDYSAGYFNALGNIAQLANLDAVIHLGDYIYEGTTRKFDSSAKLPDDEYENTHFNRNKQWWLHYYRKRYAINRMDEDLKNAHQSHPFILIWDDHEIANNSWKEGAQGHNEEKDGDWEVRKMAARQAYAEWIPIRGDASSIYRSIRFGNMAELIMTDTRLEGRDKQIYNSTNPAIFNKDRTLLGKQQKDWLFDKIKKSTCQWKIVANQVIFSEINVSWASLGGRFKDKVNELETTLLDYWQGYPSERDEILDFISTNKVNDLIILSASMHCALAFDVTKRATSHSRKGEKASYDPVTGKGSVAVEFAAPSISSANFDEKAGSFFAGTFQSLINKMLPYPINYNPNPHLKFADLQKHGYLLLNITPEKAAGTFYFVNDLLVKSRSQQASEVWLAKTGKSRLEKGKA